MKQRRFIVGLLVAATAFSMAGAAAEEENRLPIYEPGVLGPAGQVLPGGECTADSAYENTAHDRTYGGACHRLRVVFGPILAKPGQNDLLIQPVVFEKPLYDGYMTRFKPNLVSIQGTPPVEDVHLHHGTWLNAGREYGDGPWLASGEEKTIALWPQRFGLKILKDDQWLFLHMVHNATPQAFPVWVTYDMDFVPLEAGDAIQEDGEPLITNTKGIWLDAGGCGWYPREAAAGCDSYPFNPIFNAQRGFGELTDGECVHPVENCAFFNSEGRKSTQQGNPAEGILGWDWNVPTDFAGTLVVMGGHVHSGGLRDEVYLVRDLDGDGVHEASEERLIHISDAYYWNYEDSSKVGAPPISWDFSMSGSSNDLGWAVDIQPGDHLRLKGIYDTDTASWYEQMSIVMTWVAPGKSFGVDPFDPAYEANVGVNTAALQPEGIVPGEGLGTCDPGVGLTSFCVRGQVTHPHYAASSDHATCPPAGCVRTPLEAADGALMDNIPMGAFNYGPADMAVLPTAGVPTVALGEPVTFWNLDSADNMWHTVTRCLAPCTGPTSASYPISDGAYDDLIDLDTGLTVEGKTLNGEPVPAGMTVGELLDAYGPDPMDFDSSELGVGISVPEDDEIGLLLSELGISDDGFTDLPANTAWTWTPDRTGTFTFYCRIHPSMRGAVRVVDAA